MAGHTGGVNRPLVSIGLPTYNRQHLLKESLETIRRQGYSPLEILISDNGSTDGTEDYCRQLQSQDPRIRYLRHPVNAGLYPNHNFCLDKSRGEYLGLFHDDELYEPGMVSEYVVFLEDHPEVGLVCSDWELIDDSGKVIGVREFPGQAVLAGQQYIERTIRSGRSSLNCPGTMIRRSALKDARFDESGPSGFGDFVLWFRIAEQTGVGHISKRLWRYRIHREALSSKSILGMTRDFEESMGRYLQNRLARFPQDAGLVSKWRRDLRRYLFWSLIYEMCRSMRHSNSGMRGQTIFDAMGYRLTPQELQQVRILLKEYQAGFGQGAVRWGLDLLLKARITWPVEWMMRSVSVPWIRTVLGLR